MNTIDYYYEKVRILKVYAMKIIKQFWEHVYVTNQRGNWYIINNLYVFTIKDHWPKNSNFHLEHRWRNFNIGPYLQKLIDCIHCSTRKSWTMKKCTARFTKQRNTKCLAVIIRRNYNTNSEGNICYHFLRCNRRRLEQEELYI